VVETVTELVPRPVQRTHVGRNHIAGGRHDRQFDTIVGIHRTSPAESRLVGAPRCQPVDLRADDAVEKIDGLPRQFERPQQEAARMEDDLDAAAAQRRHPVDRQRFRKAAVQDAGANGAHWSKHSLLLDRCARPPKLSRCQARDRLVRRVAGLKRKRAVVVLDQSDEAT